MRAPNNALEAGDDDRHHVQLGAAHLEVVAKARVGRRHELAESAKIAARERAGRPHHTLVLRDHVPGIGAAPGARWHL